MKNIPFFALIASVLLWTGCASGPALVSLSSYLEGALESHELQAIAQEALPPTDTAGQTIGEQVVAEEEPVHERVVRERVIREEVIVEEPIVVHRPRQVYVSGGWYDPDDIIVTHVHGPGCGHYFYDGVWYNDPGLVVVDAYRPTCGYVYYDNLWYPRSDIFLRGYYRYRRPSFGAMVIWGAWPWSRWWHRDIDIDVDVYHHDRDGYRDGRGRPGGPRSGEGGRASKTETGLPEGRAGKARLADRRARPVLVNDSVGSQTASTSGVAPGLQAQKPSRTSGQSLRTAPVKGSLVAPVSGVRSTKDRRSGDALKTPRSAVGVAAKRLSPRSVQSTGQTSGRERSTLSTLGASRTSARGTSSARPEARSSGVTSVDKKSTRPVRKPGVIDVGRSSRSSRTKYTTVVPRRTYTSGTTQRESRPVLGSGRQTTTTGVQPGRTSSPSRSTSLRAPQTTTTRSYSSPRSSYSTKPSRGISKPSSSSVSSLRSSARTTSSARRSYSPSTSTSRSTKAYRSPSKSYSRPTTARSISRSSSSFSRSRSSPSISSSRSRSAPSRSISRSAPSRSVSRSAPSRSVSRSSARSSSARSARSAR